jgi:hypothetical protein
LPGFVFYFYNKGVGGVLCFLKWKTSVEDFAFLLLTEGLLGEGGFWSERSKLSKKS